MLIVTGGLEEHIIACHLVGAGRLVSQVVRRKSLSNHLGTAASTI